MRKSASPKGETFSIEAQLKTSLERGSHLDLDSTGEIPQANSDEYVQLQQRIFTATLIATALAVAITAVFFNLQSSLSVLIGALSGVIYLRLLARSVGRLGKNSNAVGKIQLIVPVLLVLAVSRFPQLELLPSLLGFLLYKPSLIIQMMLESRT